MDGEVAATFENLIHERFQIQICTYSRYEWMATGKNCVHGVGPKPHIPQDSYDQREHSENCCSNTGCINRVSDDATCRLTDNLSFWWSRQLPSYEVFKEFWILAVDASEMLLICNHRSTIFFVIRSRMIKGKCHELPQAKKLSLQDQSKTSGSMCSSRPDCFFGSHHRCCGHSCRRFVGATNWRSVEATWSRYENY